MRFSYFFTLVLAVAAGSTYWYERGSYLCPVPVYYQLGTIDESFAIDRSGAMSAIKQATDIWNGVGSQAPYFVHQDGADLTVNFVFDNRQAAADEQKKDQAAMDATLLENDRLSISIDSLQEKYEAMQVVFQARKASYDLALDLYDSQILQVNDRGGATETEFETLEEERVDLKNESEALRVLSDELSGLASQINDLSQKGNRLINSYVTTVNQYNSRYGTSEVFTQGDYTGDAINIYRFSDQAELVSILTHEFGHALGIHHVGTKGSLMYYLLAEGGVDGLELSDADIAAFADTCQFDSFDFKLRSTIRSLIP